MALETHWIDKVYTDPAYGYADTYHGYADWRCPASESQHRKLCRTSTASLQSQLQSILDLTDRPKRLAVVFDTRPACSL